MAPHEAGKACPQQMQKLTPMRSTVKSNAKKGYRKGTHRLISPLETIERVQPHLTKFGITRVANITGLDKIGLPVVSVYRPMLALLQFLKVKAWDFLLLRHLV